MSFLTVKQFCLEADEFSYTGENIEISSGLKKKLQVFFNSWYYNTL